MSGAPPIGYVKLHRKMLAWEWIGDANVVAVFVNILLRVNREPKRWKGIDIPSGSYFTSRHNLALACGITDKQVRRALDSLEKGRTIERVRAGSGLLITLVKWEEYQLSDGSEGRTRAGSWADGGPQVGPDEGRKRATTKEVKKERSKEVENEESPNGEKPKAFGDPVINELIAYFKEKLGHGLDGSEKSNRWAVARLLKALAKDYPGFDPAASARALVDAALVDPFHAKNSTNFDYLARHMQAIAKAAKDRKSQTKNMTNEEYLRAAAEFAARKWATDYPR